MTHPHLKRFYLKPTIEEIGAGDNASQEDLMSMIDTINGENNDEQTEHNISGETEQN